MRDGAFTAGDPREKAGSTSRTRAARRIGRISLLPMTHERRERSTDADADADAWSWSWTSTSTPTSAPTSTPSPSPPRAPSRAPHAASRRPPRRHGGRRAHARRARASASASRPGAHGGSGPPTRRAARPRHRRGRRSRCRTARPRPRFGTGPRGEPGSGPRRSRRWRSSATRPPPAGRRRPRTRLGRAASSPPRARPRGRRRRPARAGARAVRRARASRAPSASRAATTTAPSPPPLRPDLADRLAEVAGDEPALAEARRGEIPRAAVDEGADATRRGGGEAAREERAAEAGENVARAAGREARIPDRHDRRRRGRIRDHRPGTLQHDGGVPGARLRDRDPEPIGLDVRGRRPAQPRHLARVRRNEERNAEPGEERGVVGEGVQAVGVHDRRLPGAFEERAQQLARLRTARNAWSDRERVDLARRGEERLEIGATERAFAGEREAHRLGPPGERERQDLGARRERHEARAAAQGAGEREVRRAALSGRAGDDEEAPRVPLVRVVVPLLYDHPHLDVG